MKMRIYIKIIFLTVLLIVFSVHSQTQPPTTKLTVADYPTAIATGVPIIVTPGLGTTNEIVVTDIQIDDRSTNGWMLTITSANSTGTQPLLQHTMVAGVTMAYSMEINNVRGTLATGLTMVPAANTTLIFSGGTTTVTTVGTTTDRTKKYTFDLRISISAAETTGKIAGDYADQLTLVLYSND